MRRAAALLLAFGLCVAGAACSKKSGSSEGALLELRPVLSSNPPPCPKPKKGELVRQKTTDGKTECLELGRPVVDATDVRSATVAQDPSGDPALSVVLGGVGSADLDGFARRNQGKRLAIVTRGEVVSAPVLQYTSFAGRIQVSGLSKEKTDDLFNRLKKLTQAG
ncbi:MAG TPA: hypothetical protein VFE55_21805 [Acidimicrobiia bacterium]|nr:hypothetical protein [Acidimicrobiia bacterium]